MATTVASNPLSNDIQTPTAKPKHEKTPSMNSPAMSLLQEILAAAKAMPVPQRLEYVASRLSEFKIKEG